MPARLGPSSTTPRAVRDASRGLRSPTAGSSSGRQSFFQNVFRLLIWDNTATQDGGGGWQHLVGSALDRACLLGNHSNRRSPPRLAVVVVAHLNGELGTGHHPN